VTSVRPSDSLSPKGVQDTADVVDEWEMVSVEEFVMANVTEASEGIMPLFEEAKNRPDWPKWQEAIKAELANLKVNGTWELIERPSGVNVVDSKWVLQIKKNAASEIEKYKAHLVTRGFTQIYGVDFYKTYTPVAKLATFHLITMITACNRWPLDSFDFDSAYLNSLLRDEVIFLEQPPDHDNPKKPQAMWVCRLIKTIYGLWQGAKNWYDTLYKALTELGFQRAEADHRLFYKEENGELVILAIHVDDCLMTGGSVKLNARVKVKINEKYKLTDLGPVNWLLGIKINRNLAEHMVTLSQHAYIKSILTQYNFNI